MRQLSNLKWFVGRRLWLFGVAAVAALYWEYRADGTNIDQVLVLVQWITKPVMVSGMAYFFCKTFMHGDSLEAWKMVRDGNLAAGAWSIGRAVLAGMVFMALCWILARG